MAWNDKNNVLIITGHSLKPLDVEFMKRLSSFVNLIPVIAKADTLTEDEVISFKQRVHQFLGSSI